MNVAAEPAEGDLVVLRAGGTSVVLDARGAAVPRVLHWGADLGAHPDPGVLTAAPAVTPHAPDQPWPLTLVPMRADAWSGSPGLEAHRSGKSAPTILRQVATTHEANRLLTSSLDNASGTEVAVELFLEPSGVLRARATVTNRGHDVLEIAAVRLLMPLPHQATELLDQTGRWAREASAQRLPIAYGTHRRASRRGKSGHDGPLLLVAGERDFGFRKGSVWATHVAWSGDREHLVERLPDGAGPHAGVLGGGELLAAGEVRLEAGGTYSSPWVHFVWSDDGLDGLSRRLHQMLRARPHHPMSPRPVVLNTWEAVYFDHDLSRLTALAVRAAEVGAERYVLDDGWFLGRRNDRAGLGDWTVDPEVWPHGLHPLVDHVRGLGLQFGLWVEPEMVNPDSVLAREHPDWVLGPAANAPAEWRHQHVLDVARPEVFDYLLERLDALVTEYRLDSLKWDHNRDVLAAVRADGSPAIHQQTSAVYRLLAALRARHPTLEIESCAAGGGRIDLGILEHADRVWTSDTNDPIERQAIQRWTGVLLPPELMGAHVGAPVSHTTGRETDLTMRGLTALFGHAGIEWDLTTLTSEERRQLSSWVGLYRELRPLLHSGDVTRADLTDPGALLHGVVASDTSEALLAYVRLATSPDAQPGRVQLPGLDRDRDYRVRLRLEAGAPRLVEILPPSWWDAAIGDGLMASGKALGVVGLPFPVVAPGSGFLLHLTAVQPVATP